MIISLALAAVLSIQAAPSTAAAVQEGPIVTAAPASGETAEAIAGSPAARRKDTGVIARPMPPRDRNGQTVLLDPLPPSSIIGKGAGLIQEKPPSGLTVTRHRR